MPKDVKNKEPRTRFQKKCQKYFCSHRYHLRLDVFVFTTPFLHGWARGLDYTLHEIGFWNRVNHLHVFPS